MVSLFALARTREGSISELIHELFFCFEDDSSFAEDGLVEFFHGLNLDEVFGYAFALEFRYSGSCGHCSVAGPESGSVAFGELVDDCEHDSFFEGESGVGYPVVEFDKFVHGIRIFRCGVFRGMTCIRK